jgi:predicted nucleic acid-binding protein
VILVDSDVLIAHLRGDARARDWLVHARTERGRLSTSAVSVAEITGGMRSGERQEVWRLLAGLEVEPVTDAIARRAGELRRAHRRSHSASGLAGYLIAATADVRRLELATLNVRHFPTFPGLAPPFDPAARS